MPWHQLYISTQKLINSFSLWFIKKMKLKCLNSLTTKKKASSYRESQFFVGMTRLELATSRPPDACANQLRYIPNNLHHLSVLRVQRYT